MGSRTRPRTLFCAAKTTIWLANKFMIAQVALACGAQVSNRRERWEARRKLVMP
jgi:hypothetical protein